MIKRTHFDLSSKHAANCTEGDVRLLIGDDSEFYLNINTYEDFYFIGDELARGRVEMCIGGKYGTLCDDNWAEREASIVCHQLGFSSYGTDLCTVLCVCMPTEETCIQCNARVFSRTFNFANSANIFHDIR